MSGSCGAGSGRLLRDQAAGADAGTCCWPSSARCVVAVTDLTLVALGFGWLAWLLDVAFAVALVLLTWGAFAANSPLFGRVVNGATVTEPVVAITFDDGPSPDTTPKVLDALRTDGARATFFVLGKHAERYPEVVERIVREGHEVATHGYDHSHPDVRLAPRDRAPAAADGRDPARASARRRYACSARRTASATRS